ncbi:hypothetical protein CAPTEDRAFT_184970 [Capitella teleta]|uniref:Transposable element P transposase-like RNase H domain-containing protein n=1 Tax=Capitella teleta TaxID=283909 RepID=R7UM02_CAPTE|nr:hypothetical protein CAPTEDRAFT_184970 [Capitella teleta]|eukprot:ELU04967.1 hypothetical protein CAPTEDRAFT_184970 [Capitella teleta]
MPYRCEVEGFSSVSTDGVWLYFWPGDEAQAKLWDRFVRSYRLERRIIHFTEESEVATECSVLYNLYRKDAGYNAISTSLFAAMLHKLTTPFWPAEGNSTINGQAVAKDGVVTCSLWDREVSLGNLHISCKYGNDEELKTILHALTKLKPCPGKNDGMVTCFTDSSSGKKFSGNRARNCLVFNDINSKSDCCSKCLLSEKHAKWNKKKSARLLTITQPLSEQPAAQAFSGQPAAQAFSDQRAAQAFSDQPAAQAFSDQPAAQAFSDQPAASHEQIPQGPASTLATDIRNLGLPSATTDTILEQVLHNAKCHPNKRRWSQRTIRACLLWWCTHPRSYAQWRDLGIMTLPRKSEVQLASHVLQILFLSHSGFRFPVAHYPTHEAQAPELFHVIWEAIDKLDDWGFKVEYLCQDGAVANRQLVQIFCAGKLPRDVNFTAPSMLNPTQNMVFIMDPKHTHKKIRNGLLSSGSIRQLTLPHLGENSTVLWEHWRAAYQWDTENNPLPIHRKLTPAHMQPDSSEKMRNHLAEEVLDKDMLLLMKEMHQEEACDVEGDEEVGQRRSEAGITSCQGRAEITSSQDTDELNVLRRHESEFNVIPRHR